MIGAPFASNDERQQHPRNDPRTCPWDHHFEKEKTLLRRMRKKCQREALGLWARRDENRDSYPALRRCWL
jgi:hypothetical protein